MEKTIVNTGLRGVKVATTKISDVNGQEGKLIYRGYLAKDLAGKATFEDVVFLLLYERLPDEREKTHFRTALAEERELPDGITEWMQLLPVETLPMDVLQSATSMLSPSDPDIAFRNPEAVKRMGIRLIAKTATIVAAWARIRAGRDPVPPDPSLGHGANFLHMLDGEPPSDEVAGFFDTALVLHAEHSFNASTFSARQVASTMAHIYASISAAMGSLSGALHGGANTRVMEMLLKIGSREKVGPYVEGILERGEKIMGLGHAVYKVDDPRALILAPMSERMGRLAGETKWYEISRELEKKGKEAFLKRKGSEIFVNVDFYSASLYYSMGIPVDLFTPVFAVSRVAGWVAHVIEEQFPDEVSKPVLYRPQSEYVGDYCGPDECTLPEGW
jgi:citrate synthase